MNQMSVLKDASEIVYYNNPNIPLYIQRRKLSQYVNMEALCHSHEDIEYIRVLKGHMAFHVNGEKMMIQENDALLINSRQMHYGFSHDRTDCDFICILFAPQLLSSNPEISAKYIQPITGHHHLPYFSLDSANPETASIIAIFDKIYETYQKKEAGFELLCISSLTAFWAEWFRLLKPKLASYDWDIDEDLPVQRAMMTYIYQNYTSRISLLDIAGAGNVCRSKCCRIFRKYLNKTPVEFLNAYRLEVAMRLLTETSMSITEIALSCGFQSHSYFSELFRQYKGITPSEYRLWLE